MDPAISKMPATLQVQQKRVPHVYHQNPKFWDRHLENMRVCRGFKDNYDSVNFLSYSNGGEMLVSSSENGQIIVYDCFLEKIRTTGLCKRYGANLVHFTHVKGTVLHGATRVDDVIRHVNLETGKYIRYFCGHTDKVISLSLRPGDENTFLTSARDKTVLLWDLRTNDFKRSLQLTDNNPVASFSATGNTFTVVDGKRLIRFYDMRQLAGGPVSTIVAPPCSDCHEWTYIKVSPDGLHLMLTNNGSVIFIMDLSSQTIRHVLHSGKNDNKLRIEASFSPDTRYVASGTPDGRIQIWRLSDAKMITLKDVHSRAAMTLKFNPVYAMMASACSTLKFWKPTFTQPNGRFQGINRK